MPIKQLIATAAMAALLVAVHPVPAEANHRPKASCSDSGDICQSVGKVDGVRKLRIVLAERYFRRFHLCVRNPMGFAYCETFGIRDWGETFGRSIAWRKIFGSKGDGAYTVTWHRVRHSGDPRPGRIIGEHLGFHVRT